MSDNDTSGSATEHVYRVFCAYPQSCGAEAWADSEVEANEMVANHHHREPNHLAEYETWDAEKAKRWRDDVEEP